MRVAERKQHVMSIESALSVLGEKVESFLKGEISAAEVFAADAEKTVLGLLLPLIGAAQAGVTADLGDLIKRFLQGLEHPQSQTLDDLESLVLNAVEAAEPGLFAAARGLKGKLLQSLIGLALAAI
jgi:hypothetical protein